MKIVKNILEKAIGNQSIKINRKYINNTLKIKESRVCQTESDFDSVSQIRYSNDNGKTWDNYIDNESYYIKDGEKEILEIEGAINHNKKNGHIIKLVMRRVFLYAHDQAYRDYWEKGILNWCDSTFIKVSSNNGKTFDITYQLKYESEESIRSNIAYFGNNIEFDEFGNIYIAIVAPTQKCCDILNIDVNNISLSPLIHKGVIVYKGTFNESTNNYEFTTSKPIVIDDSLSSRGLLEPNLVFLDSGELMLECRGSNTTNKGWDTKMLPNTPSYRWVSYSNDNGETFSTPKPFTYDNNESFYSPSSMSKIIRHSVSNKLFWLGNINNNNPDGNRPRYPLFLYEIDQLNKCLIKSSCIIIDEKGKNESDLIQFSNFNIYENRVTKNIHIEYSRLGANKKLKWQGDAILVIISF